MASSAILRLEMLVDAPTASRRRAIGEPLRDGALGVQPDVVAVRMAQPVFRFEDRCVGGADRLFHAGLELWQVLGVDARHPSGQGVQRVVGLQAQGGQHATVKDQAAGREIDLPVHDLGDVDRQLQALFGALATRSGRARCRVRRSGCHRPAKIGTLVVSSNSRWPSSGKVTHSSCWMGERPGLMAVRSRARKFSALAGLEQVVRGAAEDGPAVEAPMQTARSVGCRPGSGPARPSARQGRAKPPAGCATGRAHCADRQAAFSIVARLRRFSSSAASCWAKKPIALLRSGVRVSKNRALATVTPHNSRRASVRPSAHHGRWHRSPG
jgi:hypothetical protein